MSLLSRVICCLFRNGPDLSPDEDALIPIKNPDGSITTTTVGSIEGGGGGVDEFIELDDTPSSYTGSGGYKVVVTGAEDGLEFIADTPAATAFTDLTDVPSSYTGTGGYFVKVNAGATGLEFSSVSVVTGDVVGPASATNNAIARYDLTTGKLIQNSSATVSDNGAIRAAALSSSEPSYSFAGDTDTGMFSAGADAIGFSTGSGMRWLIQNTGSFQPSLDAAYAIGTFSVRVARVYTMAVSAYTEVDVGNGSAASPSLRFLGDTNTGIYSGGTDIIGFSTNGVAKWFLNSTGSLYPAAANSYDLGTSANYLSLIYVNNIRARSGTNAAPAYSFDADSNTGILNSAADEVGITTGGTVRYTFNGTSINPFASNTYDLGTSSLKWKSAYINNILLAETITNAAGMYVQVTASRAITDADNGKILYSTSASVFTLSFPDSLTKPFQCGLIQEGTGKMTCAATGTAVMRNLMGALSTGGQWSTAYINYRTGNDVVLFGEVQP